MSFRRVATAVANVVLVLALISLFLRPIPVVFAVAAMAIALFAKRGIAGGDGQRRRLSAETIGTIALGVMGCLTGLSVLAAGGWMFANSLPKPLGIYAAHPEYVWTLEPGSHDERRVVVNEGEERDWIIDISEQGLCDRPVGPKTPDEFRVLMVGDSFTMGWGLAANETITARLETALQQAIPDRKITVLNGGVVGYGPWQTRGFLNERGFALEPDLVIAQLFPGNDVEGSLEAINKHLDAYDAAWKRNFYSRVDRQDWHIRLQTWVVYHVPGWQTLEKWADNPNLFVDILNSVRVLPPYTTHEFPPSVDRPYFLEPNLKDDYPMLAEGWERFAADVAGMKSDCEARGIEFVAYCVPEAACIDDTLWQKDVTEAGLTEQYERGRDAVRAESLLRESGVAVIPIADALAIGEKEAPTYFRLDRHFSPHGARVTADALASGLDELNMLPN